MRQPPRLVVENRRGAVNERLPLGVTLTGVLDDGNVLITGLAARAQLSAGAAVGDNGWRVPTRDLASIMVQPLRNFAGAMDLTVDLRLPDDTVADSNVTRLEWVAPNAPAQVMTAHPTEAQPMQLLTPAPAAVLRLTPEEIATLLKRGQELIAYGDLAAARLVFRRAADNGDAQAALALGSTYDPAVLTRRKVVGLTPDPAQARAWYQRAVDLGSSDASRRLEQLAQSGR